MNKELIKPDNLTPQLHKQLLELKKCLEFKVKVQKTMPAGHLRIAQNTGTRHPQFYHFTSTDHSNGSYLPHSKMAFIKKLAQKDYDQKLINQLRIQIKTLEKYLTKCDGKIEQLYSKLPPIRQQLITPATLTNEQYIEEWRSETWQGLAFSEDSQDFYTANKERVRSKSEVIIADTLKRYGIPYKYEYPLEFGGITFHPDFLCLNVHTRQEFIWEHFGMMDCPDYLEKAIQKIRVYNENKYYLGKNLIITMETKINGIKTQQLERLIETYLS